MTTKTLNGQEVLRLHPGIYRGRLSRRAGWRMLPGGVKVDRTSRWGNPWLVNEHRTAEEAVFAYWRHLNGRMAVGILSALLAPLVARHRQHGYLVLYCWCKFDQPCHCHPLADALAKELERQTVARFVGKLIAGQQPGPAEVHRKIANRPWDYT